MSAIFASALLDVFRFSLLRDQARKAANREQTAELNTLKDALNQRLNEVGGGGGSSVRNIERGYPHLIGTQ